MATLILLTSLFVSRWSFIAKRSLVRHGQSETVAAKFHTYLLEWTMSLAIVLLFYHALLLVVAVGWRWITVGKVAKLEGWLVATKDVLNQYKPSWAMWLGVLIALYLCSDMWIRFLDRDTPFRIFKKTKRFLRVVNIVAFLLASLTLLGFNPGKPAVTLEIHLQ